MALSPLNARRWRNFKRNGRALWSLVIFSILFGLSLFAELLANDRPLLVSYRGEIRSPIVSFYSEQDFGGDFPTEAAYSDPEVQCLIATGGLTDCFDAPREIMAAAEAGETLPLVANDMSEFERGWLIWPPIPYAYDTIVDVPGVAPAPPSETNWLGTDDTKRDVVARVIYGFRLSIVFAILGRSFWLLVFLTVLFGWPALVGVVRAEFLRARNFEYIRAARALGVSDSKIMFRHMLPNAMVATVTMLPFLVTGAIGTLASLDFLGFGLPSSAPSLGELTLQAKQNLQAPWLGFTAFFTFAIMLSLLVFIFEGVRDAFDPRKTFS